MVRDNMQASVDDTPLKAVANASSELGRRLASIRFDADPVVAALIEKTAPGVHARRRSVEVGPAGFTGDHPRKSWWRGSEIPGRDVTAMAAEVLDVLSAAADVPGDNLITRGVDLGAMEAGDRLIIGPVVLRRSRKPHSPCDVFARRTSPEAMRAVAATNTRGALFVVEKTGMIGAGDAVRVVRGGKDDS